MFQSKHNSSLITFSQLYRLRDWSLKRASYLSLKKGKLFVPQKGQVVCPSKRASYLSLKKGRLFVPPKGQVICPSKRERYLSLKMGT